MSKFDQNRIKDGWEKLHKQTDGHYKNNGHLAVNQKIAVYAKQKVIIEVRFYVQLDIKWVILETLSANLLA